MFVYKWIIVFKLFKILRLVLFLAILLVSFNYCRADNNSNEKQNKKFYLKAKFNGELKSFESLYSTGKGYNNGKLISLALTYHLCNTKEIQYPQVKVFILSKNANTDPLASGTYTEDDHFIEFEFKTINSESKASKSALKDFFYTITEVNSKTIKGTFSGTIENDLGEIITVSEGEFLGFEK